MEYTRGNWNFCKYHNGDYGIYSESEDSTRSHNIAIVRDKEEVTLGNALLISAVPEFYNFVNHIALDPYALTPDQWAREAWQILNKAEGR